MNDTPLDRIEQYQIDKYYIYSKDEDWINKGIENQEDKVLLLIDDVGCDRIHSLHRSGDVFLCLNDGHYPLTDTAAASLCQNKIVQYPTEGLDQEYIYNNKFNTITNNKIRDIINNIEKHSESPEKYATTKIEEILC